MRTRASLPIAAILLGACGDFVPVGVADADDPSGTEDAFSANDRPRDDAAKDTASDAVVDAPDARDADLGGGATGP